MRDYKAKSSIRETPDNRKAQEYIRGRALYSLALLGMSFVYHGSGKFLNLRPLSKEELESRTA